MDVSSCPIFFNVQSSSPGSGGPHYLLVTKAGGRGSRGRMDLLTRCLTLSQRNSQPGSHEPQLRHRGLLQRASCEGLDGEAEMKLFTKDAWNEFKIDALRIAGRQLSMGLLGLNVKERSREMGTAERGLFRKKIEEGVY